MGLWTRQIIEPIGVLRTRRTTATPDYRYVDSRSSWNIATADYQKSSWFCKKIQSLPSLTSTWLTRFQDLSDRTWLANQHAQTRHTTLKSLKTANQSFWKTIWLIMMHHHTKFGIKRFSNSENIIQTSIHWHFEILLQPWPWTKPPNFSIKHSCL